MDDKMIKKMKDLAEEKNVTACDITRMATEECLEKERVIKECREGLIHGDICKKGDSD